VSLADIPPLPSTPVPTDSDSGLESADAILLRQVKTAMKGKSKAHQAIPGLALAHPCPDTECPQHLSRDPPVGFFWDTCSAGHGWMKQKGILSSKCHLCGGYPRQPIAGKTHVPLPLDTPTKSRVSKSEPRAEDEGYCYLGAFPTRGKQLEMAKALGPYPTLKDWEKHTGADHSKLTTHTRDNYVWYHYDRLVEPQPHTVLDYNIRLGALDITKVLLNSNMTDAVLLPLQKEFSKEVEYMSLVAPFKLTAAQQELLSNVGIATHPLPVRQHPHPVHKTLENNLLFNNVRHLIKGKPTLLMNMKAEKAQKLAGLCHLDYRLWNPGLTPRDLTRWTPTPRPTHFAPKIAVLHDSGHYVEPNFFFALFAAFPSIEQVLFTAILPFEAAERSDSVHPSLYTLSHGTDTFQYVLADMSENMNKSSYPQPYSGLRWLHTNEISQGGLELCVERLESFYAHHLFVITPKLGGMIKRVEDFLPSPDVIKLPQLDPLVPLAHPWVPAKIYRSVLTHALAISSYKLQDVWAKTRNAVAASAGSHLPMATLHQLACLMWAVKQNSVAPDTSLFSRWRLRLRLWLLAQVERRSPWLAQVLFPKLWHARRALELATLPVHREHIVLSTWASTAPYDLAQLDATHAALYAGPPHHHSSAASSAISTNVLPDPHLPPPDASISFRVRPASTTASSSSTSSRPTIHIRAHRLLTENEVTRLTTALNVPRAQLLDHLERRGRGRPDEPVYELPLEPIAGLPFRVHANAQFGAIALPPPIPAAMPQLNQTFARRVVNTSELTSQASVLEHWDLPPGPYGPVPYPRHDCLLRALSKVIGVSTGDLWTELCTLVPHAELSVTDVEERGLSSKMGHMLCLLHEKSVQLAYPAGAPDKAPPRIGVYGGADATIVWHPQFGDRNSHWEWHQSGPAHQYNQDAPPAGFAELWGGAPVESMYATLPFKPWTNSPKRARVFFNAWSSREIGVLFQETMRKHKRDVDAIHFELKNTPASTIELLLVHGAPGCGKSWPIISKFIAWARNPMNNVSRELLGTYIAFFRNALLADWKQKLALPSTSTYCLKTWEKLLPYEIEFLIIDELSQCPPGFLDFVVTQNPRLQRIITLGDVCQGQWNSGKADPLEIDSLPTAITTVLPCSTPYINYTRRLPILLSARMGITTLSEVQGTITCSHRLRNPKKWTTLIPSTHDVTRWKELTQSANVFTFTSPQGREWDHIQVVVTPAALLGCADEAWWTALTRTKADLHFVMVVGVEQQMLRSRRILGAALGLNQPFDRFRAFPAMAACPQFFHQRPAEVFGCGLRTVGEEVSTWNNSRLDDLPPALRALVPTLTIPDQLVDRLLSADPLEPVAATHLPAPIHPLNWSEIDPPAPREERELFWDGEMGGQYPDTRGTKTAVHDLGSAFPIQSASHDATLFPTAVAKRIRFRSAAENTYRFAHSAVLAPVVFERFREHYGLPEDPPPFEPEIFAECIVENTMRKLEKPLAQLIANARRADADWAVEYIHLFVKSQLKAKAETLGHKLRADDDDPLLPQAVRAKAGQTLATCADENILTFGPMARYLVRAVTKHLPAEVYLHGGKTIEQLDSWAKTHARAGDSFTCDFTAYDQSCTEETLGFEVCLAEYFGIPPDLIGLMVWVKLNARTQLGPIAVQRLTGEAFTYAFNTFWNMAYMAMRYEVPPGCPRCFSGDDSLFYDVIAERKSWPMIESFFTLEGKTLVTPVPEFCGWYLYPVGAIRNPALLALKIAFRQTRGELAAVLDSYYLEALFAHRKGDLLVDTLPPLAQEAQRWVMDFCYQHASIVHHLTHAGVRNKQHHHIPLHLLPSSLQ